MISLDFTDLGLAFGLVAIAIALSAWQKLGLEGQFFWASLRTVVQLGVVGYVLAVVFAPTGQHPAIVIAVLLILLTLISIFTRNRISRKIPNLLGWVWASLFISTLLILLYVNFLVIQPPTWYDPQYWIPLAALILGQCLNGAIIAGERLVSTLNAHQMEIETQLCLGATPEQAIAPYRKDAIQAALMPTLNGMMTVGLITLPGVLSGQLLAGVEPLDGVSYQVLILLMLALANLMTTLLLTYGISRQFFNPDAQFQRF